MKKSEEIKDGIDQSAKHEIAMFRFGIISDFTYKLTEIRGEKERLFDEKTKSSWQIPFTTRTHVGRSCIKTWIRRYENANRDITSLYPKRRSDAGVRRAIKDDVAQSLIELRQELPGSPVTKLIVEMGRRGLIADGNELKYNNAIRFLHDRELVDLSRVGDDIANEKETLRMHGSWLHRLLQGKVPCEELEDILSEQLPREDIKVLHHCILNRSIKYRNRAVTVLARSRGISLQAISEYLSVPISTLTAYMRRYREGRTAKLLKLRKQIIRKHQKPEYIDTLFSVIHSPPSAYGFNRTSWIQRDIQKVMADRNMPISKGYIAKIVKGAGYRYRKAKTVLTSNDPEYREKLNKLMDILSNLQKDEKFFSVDEYGPFAVKVQGGSSLMPPGQTRTVPQKQKSKGSLIITAALELSTNQVTHFYSKEKNTDEMIKLLDVLMNKYKDQRCIYFSWDAASWHASKRFKKRVEQINNSKDTRLYPIVKLVPLPTSAQFLNVIESVFSGMSRAIIQNSNYSSVEEAMSAIDRYFQERNQHFKCNPKKAGRKIWGEERVKPLFKDSNNCKDPRYR